MVILYTHLSLGLTGAVFLVILGLTGSVIAFEGDIEHWVHPGLWYVSPQPKALPENDLISMVHNRYPRNPVVVIQLFRDPHLVQLMQLTDGTLVYVNPYDGRILGESGRLSTGSRFLGYIHQIHLRLVPDPRSAPELAAAGKIVVSIAGAILFLMVPTGVILWWRAKRTSINWKAKWHVGFFDAHRVVGIYAAIFLFIASATGVLIGFDFGEKVFYAMTHSSPPAPPLSFRSTPLPDTLPIMTDQAVDIARRAIPNSTPAMIIRPIRAIGAYTIMMRIPEETSEAVHSSVTIDQYSGRVLQARNFLEDSAGYRLIRFNRSLHTGDIYGLPTHILMSLSSLMLVVMVVTGVVIWWKKLAV